MKKKIFTILLALAACVGASWAAPAVAVNGKLPGAFSVSATKVVYFSSGNLQYTKSTGKWKIMDHQYDMVETLSQNVGTNYADQDVVTLFGWGTSGWDNTAADATSVHYQPYSTCNTNHSTANNNYQYGPSYANVAFNQSWSKEVAGNHPYENYDWGVFNSGDLGAGWRTLTNDEWGYLIDSRTPGNSVNGVSNARYTKATINTDGTAVNGIILFPDDAVMTSVSGVTWGSINDKWSVWGTKCTSAGWTALETAGCVFLPAAGSRNETSVLEVGATGYYWSSSANSYTNGYGLRFHQSSVGPQNSYYRYLGHSVRLVSETAPAAPTPATPIAVENGTKGGFSYTLYDNGLLEISGSGAMPNHAFVEEDFSADVKNIRFAKDCEVYSLGDMWFRCYDSKYSQLETVEINSVVPISFLGEGIFYKQESAVTITITAPGIVNVESEIVGNYYSPVNMIFNVPATTVFEKNWFLRNQSYYAITIPTGATGHVPASLAFTDPDKQSQYDDAVEMGNEEWFWDMFGDGLKEGVDYNKVEESTFVITAENASQIFGPATVYFQDPEPQPQPAQDVNITPYEDPENPTVYYSTFYDSEVKYLLPENVEAYVATLNGANLLLSKIADAGQTIPADNAVILKSTVTPFTLSISDAEAVPVNAINSLQGTDVSIATPANCYVLAGNDGVGFYHYTASMLNPHKAYVIYSGTPNQAPHRMPFVFNQATDVESIQPSAVSSQKVFRDGQLVIIRNGVEYNAAGQMVK